MPVHAVTQLYPGAMYWQVTPQAGEREQILSVKKIVIQYNFDFYGSCTCWFSASR
jgi:hypothetical protein